MIIEKRPTNFSQSPKVVSPMAKRRRRSVSPAEPAYRLAKVLVEQEKWEDAIAAYQQVLTIAPTWVEVQRELGDLLLKLERWEEAIKVYETAITLQSDVVQVHHNLGDALLKLQRWNEAVIAYQKAIELNPEFSWSYNNLGDALRELQRWDEAAEAYRKAINLNGNFALSHHNLGDVLVKKEKLEEAIAAYQKAIELDPNFVWSHYNLGDVLSKQEEWDSAIAAYRSAVKLNPNLPQVHEKLGDALRHQIQKYSEEVSEVYYQAIQKDETDLQVYYKALEVNPRDAEMTLRLADTLRNQGKIDQAITFYKRTLKIESNNAQVQVQAWQSLGEILQNLGRLEEAEKAYHQVGNWKAKTIPYKIVLFTPYYKDQYPERQDELIYCIRKNIECPEIEKIVLLIDDGHQPELENPKIEIIRLSSRATYRDWIKLTEARFTDKISVLANTDIYLDQSISWLRDIFSTNPNAFIALSRYEQQGSEQTLHKNPHQSQDVWAVYGGYNFSESLKKSLEVPLGFPRCDNKIAYLFSVHGAKVYNPCNYIKIVHVHETQLRSYDKYGDTTILGSTAWVYPSENLNQPSKLQMNVWTLNPDEVANIQINDSLILWREQRKDQALESSETALDSEIVKAMLEKSQEKIRQFHNKHLGQRCVIIGNGPSLNEMDLSFLKHEICFGTNKIYLGFERWEFSPTYYVGVNPYVIEQSVEEIRKIPCPKFIGNRGISYFDPTDDIIFIKTFPSPGEPFSKYPDVGLNEGFTVTYVAMQLAYYMGFSEVVLIGVDHHFVTQGTPYKAIISDGDDPNHFDPDYFGKGLTWQLPDLDASEKSYLVAKKVFEESGRKIIDATVNGRCQVFPKQDYQQVFQEYFKRISSSSLHIKKENFNKPLIDECNPQFQLEQEEKELVKQHPFPHGIFLPTSKVSLQDRVQGLKKVIKIYRETYNSYYKGKLIELKDKFKSYDRAFIIGNGPSLNYTDLEFLNKEVTFGVNGIFLKSQETGWKPTFYVVEDHLVAEDRQNDINSYEGPIKLFPITLAYCLEESPNTIFFNHQPRISYPDGYDFSRDASICTYTGCTVTFTCMQLAYFLGFKNIYLIGVDASYSIPQDVQVYQEYQTQVLDMESNDTNHFNPNYFGKGYRWHDPQVHKMKEAYKEARRVCNETNINIFNATQGGYLEVFPRVNYYSLFNQNEVYPRLLIIDMTKLGSVSATGQIKKNLLADWSRGNWLQIYTEGKDIKLFSEADLVSHQDQAISEEKLVEECRRFNPKVIYYRPVADQPFLHTLACKIIEKVGCPVVTHIMDDWLERLSRQNSGLYVQFDRSIRILLEQSATRLSISDQMSEEFKKRYNLDFVPIANCIEPSEWINICPKSEDLDNQKYHQPFIIRYIGGLADDMNFTGVCDLVNCIVKLEKDLDVKLEIYTQKQWKQKAENKFLDLPNISIHEAKFSQEEYRRLLGSANALIIAYNFDEDSIRYVKYSMSNKLPECLASGTPVLVYGPEEIATVKYIAQTELVQIVSERDNEKLSAAICNLVTKPDLYQQMAKKAQKFAFENHSNLKIRHKFQSILRKAAMVGQPVSNLLSSLLNFDLVCGFSRSNHAHLSETDLVFEFFQENSSRFFLIDVNDNPDNNVDKFANAGWRIFKCDPDLFTSSNPNLSLGLDHILKNNKMIDVLTKPNEQGQVDSLPSIDFLKIDTEANDFIVLKTFTKENLKVSVIQCKFDDQKTVPLGYTFHDLAQFLIEKGYTVIVSEWHPLIKSRIKQDWYRLTKYPCQLGDVKAWGYLIAFKSEPDWLNILNLAKKVLHLKALIIRDAKFHIENAKVLEKQVNLEGAIQEIRMAIDIEPDKMELHYKMGELLLKDKKFKEAVSYYQKTIELKPDYFWAFRGLGDALKEQGELDEALKFYRQAIELNPNYFYPYDKIARVLEMQGKLSEAISYFRQALKLKPNSEATLNGLEQCLKKQQISKQ